MKATNIMVSRTEQQTHEREQTRRAARRIMDYLAEYPRARDTTRGVAEWWTRTSRAATQEALDFLVATGFLVVSTREGQELFARNPEFGPAEMVRLVADLPNAM